MVTGADRGRHPNHGAIPVVPVVPLACFHAGRPPHDPVPRRCVRRRPRDSRPRRAGRRAGDARRRRPSIRLGVGDEAGHRHDRPDRRGAWPARPRRASRPSRLDRSAPPLARVGPAVRRRGAPGGPGPKAHLLEPGLRPVGRAGRRPGRQELRNGARRLGPAPARDGPDLPRGSTLGRTGRPDQRPRRVRPGAAPSDAAVTGVRGLDARGGVRRALGCGARHRSVQPLRLGPGRRAARRQAAALDGRGNSPATFGHFGGSGTFLWVDPAVDRALVVLADRGFGAWALDAWPVFSDAVLAALR